MQRAFRDGGGKLGIVLWDGVQSNRIRQRG